MKQKKMNFPSKTTINLVIKEKSAFRLSRTAPLICLIIVLVALFAKFAVVDQLTKIAYEQDQLAAAKAHAAQLEAATADYEEIAAQHSRYASGWMSEEEQALPDRLTALELVENALMAKAVVRSLTMQGNLLSVTFDNLTLEGASALLQALSLSELVEDVDIFTASNQQQSGADTTSILITLRPAAQPDAEPTTEGGTVQ